MAVSSTTNRVSYTGNGVTTAFAFSYPFQSTSDLKVLKVTISTGAESLQVLNTDYTISGTTSNGVYPSGGTVNMTSAPSALYKLVIYRDPALTQTIDLVENDALPAETLEQGLDKSTLINQRTRELVDRAVTLPDGFTGTFDPALPSDINTADVLLKVNAAGDGFEIGPTTVDIADAEENAALAKDWATKTDGQVATTDYSSKAWAIGGAGVTDTSGKGAAKEWAIETASTVDGTDYSAKEWAKGEQVRGIASGGSSKDWATYTSGTVDNAEYSAKEHAQGTQTRGLAGGGSAKDWAQYTGGTVDNANYSAKYHATAAATSAAAALVSENNAATSAAEADGVANSSYAIINCGIAASVAASALTVSIKTKAGSNASGADPVRIAFGDATITDGEFALVNLEAALSLTITSGSTLGQISGIEANIFVYAINNAGTIKLGVSRIKLDEGKVHTTVAEGGAGGADSSSSLYSDAVYSNIRIRLIGKIVNTQATAGTWATAPSAIILNPIVSDFIGCAYKTDAGQAINNNSVTTIVFEDRIYDTHGMMNTSTGIATIKDPGKYLIIALGCVEGITTWSAGERTSGYLVKNSATYLKRNVHYIEATIGSTIIVAAGEMSCVVDLALNDTVEYQMLQNSGGNTTIYSDADFTQIHIIKVG